MAGEAVDVEDTEYRKPLDLVRSEQGPALRCDTAPAPAVSQAVCPRSLESPFRGQAQSVRSAFECWSVVRVTEDLIVLTCGGGTLSTQPSELAHHFPCPCHGAMPAMPAMPLLVSFFPSGDHSRSEASGSALLCAAARRWFRGLTEKAGCEWRRVLLPAEMLGVRGRRLVAEAREPVGSRPGRCGAVFCQVDVVAARLDPADPTLAAFGGGEDVVCAATSS